MADDKFYAETPVNYEQKTLCVFVVDVSTSMSGAPIDELNHGIKTFINDVSSNDTLSPRLEIAIITFSSEIKVIQAPALVDEMATFRELIVEGSTRMVDGVTKAIEMISDRKRYYVDTGIPYLRPWIVLITDGAPDGNQDVESLSRKVNQDGINKHYVLLPIGVENADFHILDRLATIPFEKAEKLNGLEFSKFFRWLSNSIGIVATATEGQKVNLPQKDWTAGFEV